MRFTRFATLLFFAALTVVGLSACDYGEQNYDIEPGDELSISGPNEVTVPAGTATFNIFPYTIEKAYNWTVEGPGEASFTTRRGGEFIDVDFDEPGTYTVTVDNGENTGSLPVVATYTDVVAQGDRMGFGTLANVFGDAGLTDTLSSSGPFTVLAPTNEAFVAAFDTTDEGALNTPGDEVLADILQYHVVTDSLRSAEISEGQEEETFEGSEVIFHTNGDITVEDGTGATDDATFTEADIPASNGLIHGIDDVLLPPTASVAFNDQTATNSVNVRSVYLPDGGFVAIHDSTLTTDDDETGSVIGVSEKLEAGIHNNVSVELFDETMVPGAVYEQDELQEDQTLIARPHRDDPDDGIYEFVLTGGTADEAYTEDDEAVTDDAVVTVGEE